MSDKNNPQRLERIAATVEDEAIKEVILTAAKEIKRVRTRLKDGHVERAKLQAEITSVEQEKVVVEAKLDRLWELNAS